MTQTHRDGCFEGRGREEGDLVLRFGLRASAVSEHARRGSAGIQARTEGPGRGPTVGGGPMALKEHVVRTKGARIQKLTFNVTELLDTFHADITAT